MSALAANPLNDRVEDRVNADLSTMTVGICVVGGHELRLSSNPLVFKPTLTTLLLTEQVLNAGLEMRTVLDLGCGSAPIAIALALSGARHVYATDLMPQASALAAKNVRLNHVQQKITVLNGDLFEPVRRMKFDIIVDDDGPGLAETMRESVLQRGVRADEAAPGSGLGLAIVRDLAEVYRGSIALEASPERGLRARLRLPA